MKEQKCTDKDCRRYGLSEEPYCPVCNYKHAFAKGRAEGMREAARINQDLARKYHGVGQEAWATVLCDGADAILSAIGDSQ